MAGITANTDKDSWALEPVSISDACSSRRLALADTLEMGKTRKYDSRLNFGVLSFTSSTLISTEVLTGGREGSMNERAVTVMLNSDCVSLSTTSWVVMAPVELSIAKNIPSFPSTIWYSTRPSRAGVNCSTETTPTVVPLGEFSVTFSS